MILCILVSAHREIGRLNGKYVDGQTVLKRKKERARKRENQSCVI